LDSCNGMSIMSPRMHFPLESVSSEVDGPQRLPRC